MCLIQSNNISGFELIANMCNLCIVSFSCFIGHEVCKCRNVCHLLLNNLILRVGEVTVMTLTMMRKQDIMVLL